jgi:putative hydrolase of the HAD superfamily
MAEPTYDLVLFDLGGVLIQPGGVGPMRVLAGIDSDEELWTRWLGCRYVQTFEAGACTPEEFAAGVVDDWQLSVSPTEFLEAFGSWAGEPYPGAAALVSRIRRVVPAGFLSNMNAFQWERHYQSLSIIGGFDYRFLSYELGLVKPDPRIFAAVAARLPVPAERVLYLDDNAVNVDAGAAAGFVSHHVRGIDETHRLLEASGLLGE